MAHPIAIAAALSRLVKIACPRCGHAALVTRVPRDHRVCPRCRERFADPRAGLARPRR
jgi:ribosomal protein S27E